jgi:hypothetical protein
MMKAKAALRCLAGMLAVVCAFVLAERTAGAQQVCTTLSTPYISGGAPLTLGPTGLPAPVPSALGSSPVSAALPYVRVRNLGVGVGQQLLLGAINVPQPDIVTVVAVNLIPQSGYAVYTITAPLRPHAWIETVYRAWSGSVCLPACAAGTNSFPACLPTCPSYSPCTAAAIPPPPPPGAPGAPGMPGAGVPGAPGAPGMPSAPPAVAPGAPPAPPPAWPAPPAIPGAPAMPGPAGMPGAPAAPGVPPPPPPMP